MSGNIDSKSLCSTSDGIINEFDLSTVDLVTEAEIEDICDDFENNSSLSRYLIIKCFHFLLTMLGWMPFGTDNYRHRKVFACINIIFPISCTTVLILGYAGNMVAVTQKFTPVEQANYTCGKFSSYSNIFIAYEIPDILNFMSYIYGLFYYRYNGTFLGNTLDKVLWKCKKSEVTKEMNSAFQFKLGWLFTLVIFWFAASLTSFAAIGILQSKYCQLCFFQYKIDTPFTLFHLKFWLIVLVIFGKIFYYMVYLVIIANYIIMCEITLYSFQCVSSDIAQKCLPIKEMIHDIWSISCHISFLNMDVGRNASICLLFIAYNICYYSLIWAELIKVYFKADNENNCVLICLISMGVILFSWILLAMFPIVQACRVNTIERRLQKLALEMRLFGYTNATIDELDSFLSFVSICQMKAKLLWLRISAGKFTLLSSCLLLATLFFIKYDLSS